MYCILIGMLCCMPLTSCGSDDDDDGDSTQTENDGSNGAGTGTDGTVSFAQIEKRILGTWVNGPEYSQWIIYMKQGNTEASTKLMDNGIIFNSDHTGAWLYTRLNNSFSSWRYKDGFTWKILRWEEKGTYGEGSILITTDGKSSIHIFHYGYNSGIKNHITGEEYGCLSIFGSSMDEEILVLLSCAEK